MPFKCNTCGKKFALDSDLKNHESVHKNAKPFHCASCDKKFRLERYLTKHKGVHKNKPYSCQECDKTFHKESKLKNHEKIHKAGEAFSCQARDKTKKHLRIGNLNICKGLNNKEAQLLNMIEEEEIDIIGVSETDLKDFDESLPYTLRGFKTFWPLKRSKANMKRMLCFVKQDVEVKERTDLMSSQISSIWLEHKPVNGKKILLCLTYREFNPCTGEEEIDKTNVSEQLSRLELFRQQVEKAAKETENIYILGDLNVDINRWNNKDYYLKKVAEEYQTLIGKNGLELIDFGITWKRIQENGVIKQSALDHLLTNQASSIINNKTIKVTYSDHSAILADIATSKQKARKLKITSRDLRKLRSNPRKFSEELSKIDWAQITEKEDLDVDDMVDFWTREITKKLDILAPQKTRNLSKNKKVQFPKEVSDKLELLQEMEMEIEQNEASGKMDKGLIKKYKKHKNHINRLQKRIIMEQKGIAITPQSSTNEIWKTSREVLRPGNQVVTQMKIVKDGVEIVNPKELAENFGTFFIKKVDDIVEEIQAHKSKIQEKPENSSASIVTEESQMQKSPLQDLDAPIVTKISELQKSPLQVPGEIQKTPENSSALIATRGSELQINPLQDPGNVQERPGNSIAPIVTRNSELQKSPLQDPRNSSAPTVTENLE